MIKKILPIIVIFMTLSVASPYYIATAQSSQSLGTVINSTINGVKTALQNVKSGTAAYQQLSGSLTYLNVAQKLYNEGNYTGAEYYLKLAMNESYQGVINAGGEPFTVPPGLNVSREIALNYAQRIELIAQNIKNATIREQVMSNISQVISMLEAPGNASQIAHDLAQSRQVLGNVNAEVHQYTKARFAQNFKHYFMPILYMKLKGIGHNVDAAFNVTISQEVKDMQFENASQIARHMYDYQKDYTEAELIMPAGTIGVYDNLVYINFSYPLPVIQLGSQSYTVNAWVLFYPIQPNVSVLGVINDTSAYQYVMSNAGSQVTVFPPSHDDVARVHVTLDDIGVLPQQPKSNLTVYYTPTQRFTRLTDDQEFNMSGFFGITNRTVVMIHHDHKIKFTYSSIQVSFNDHGKVNVEYSNGTEVSFNNENMSGFINGRSFNRDN